ncbi:MAG: DUF4097 domain-containing protein [bacterium]|nr:DUF4097 domain-containing protein [bacterium]
MKRFMKGCAVTALILLIAGLILGVAAGSFREKGSIAETVRRVTGGRVRINLGFGAGEDWGITWGEDLFGGEDDVNYEIEDSVNFDSHHEIHQGNVEKYALEGTAEKLQIEVGACTLSVEDSGDDSFYVEGENVGKLQAYVESGTLYLRSSVKGSVKSWSELGGARITLYVPEGCSFQEAEINVGAGIFSFPRLHAEEASVNVGAGKITLTGVEAARLKIEVGAGQAELTDMKVTELEVEVGMGEFAGDGEIERRVSAECSMGNLDLCVVGRQEDFNYEISSAMGRVTLGAYRGDGHHGEEHHEDDHHSQSYGGFSAGRSIDNGADKDMELSCSMGNVTVSFRE